MEAINWIWVLILLVLACPISMLLMRRGHRQMNDERPMGDGMSHKSAENRRTTASEVAASDASALRPRNELQSSKALEGESEAFKGDRPANDSEHKH